MKQIFLPLLFLLPNYLSAQDLSFSPDTIIIDEAATLDEYNLYQIDFVNETSDTLYLSWRLIENTMPEDWFIQLCDNSDCYGTIPNYEEMNPIAPGAYGFMKMDIHPEMIEGTGMMRYLIYETGGDILDNDGIEFHVTAGNPVSTTHLLKANVDVFPNPVADQLVLQNNDQQDYQWELHSPEGKKLLTGSLASGSTAFYSTLGIPSGFYILQMRTNAKMTARKVFIQR
ncbi:MAG: T9SS type A sorting domain-containing protein [Bacteroidetes bacterium]|nr:T9SS type A sorting domain-containing protein [Bacteroidota bacterium]